MIMFDYSVRELLKTQLNKIIVSMKLKRSIILRQQ